MSRVKLYSVGTHRNGSRNCNKHWASLKLDSAVWVSTTWSSLHYNLFSVVLWITFCCCLKYDVGCWILEVGTGSNLKTMNQFKITALRSSWDWRQRHQKCVGRLVWPRLVLRRWLNMTQHHKVNAGAAVTPQPNIFDQPRYLNYSGQIIFNLDQNNCCELSMQWTNAEL